MRRRGRAAVQGGNSRKPAKRQSHFAKIRVSLSLRRINHLEFHPSTPIAIHTYLWISLALHTEPGLAAAL